MSATGAPGALYQFSPFLVRARPDRFTFEARFREGGFHVFEAGFDGAPVRALLVAGEGHGIRRAETWALLKTGLGRFLRDAWRARVEPVPR